jgi:AcrR family transcriptional regulator
MDDHVLMNDSVPGVSISDWTRALLEPADEAGRRRAALLQAAFDTIAEAGFEGLRTRAVAQRAGVNIATLHYYFPSKQDLIEGLAQWIGAKFVTLHGPAPKPSGLPALDRLRQEFADGRFYLREHPEMLLVMQEFGLRAQRDAAVMAVTKQMNGHWRQGIEQMVEAGVADGTFRGDVPPCELTAMLMTLFAGVAGRDAAQMDAIARHTEDWLLSARAKRKLAVARKSGAKG